MSKKHKVKAAAASVSPSAAVMDPGPEAPQLAELADARIAARAYSYWEARGCQGGSPEDDWARATEELKAERNL